MDNQIILESLAAFRESQLECLAMSNRINQLMSMVLPSLSELVDAIEQKRQSHDNMSDFRRSLVSMPPLTFG
ncbi:hypothetical protein M413DRAFT_439188 [Hebeloma cylindrosporum]|uniref:Uncharacterized protein n=1 Tax=Hebeloma cylindrosporum TaxID=76867 RepID=A0A0C2Z2M7_HEBCY|nr:hypothetical protein M413DRAFT_439188 [Hebeloma cylindrosporum h7]